MSDNADFFDAFYGGYDEAQQEEQQQQQRDGVNNNSNNNNNSDNGQSGGHSHHQQQQQPQQQSVSQLRRFEECLLAAFRQETNKAALSMYRLTTLLASNELGSWQQKEAVEALLEQTQQSGLVRLIRDEDGVVERVCVNTNDERARRAGIEVPPSALGETPMIKRSSVNNNSSSSNNNNNRSSNNNNNNDDGAQQQPQQQPKEQPKQQQQQPQQLSTRELLTNHPDALFKRRRFVRAAVIRVVLENFVDNGGVAAANPAAALGLPFDQLHRRVTAWCDKYSGGALCELPEVRELLKVLSEVSVIVPMRQLGGCFVDGDPVAASPSSSYQQRQQQMQIARRQLDSQPLLPPKEFDPKTAAAAAATPVAAEMLRRAAEEQAAYTRAADRFATESEKFCTVFKCNYQLVVDNKTLSFSELRPTRVLSHLAATKDPNRSIDNVATMCLFHPACDRKYECGFVHYGDGSECNLAREPLHVPCTGLLTLNPWQVDATGVQAAIAACSDLGLPPEMEGERTVIAKRLDVLRQMLREFASPYRCPLSQPYRAVILNPINSVAREALVPRLDDAKIQRGLRGMLRDLAAFLGDSYQPRDLVVDAMVELGWSRENCPVLLDRLWLAGKVVQIQGNALFHTVVCTEGGVAGKDHVNNNSKSGGNKNNNESSKQQQPAPPPPPLLGISGRACLPLRLVEWKCVDELTPGTVPVANPVVRSSFIRDCRLVLSGGVTMLTTLKQSLQNLGWNELLMERCIKHWLDAPQLDGLRDMKSLGSSEVVYWASDASPEVKVRAQQMARETAARNEQRLQQQLRMQQNQEQQQRQIGPPSSSSSGNYNKQEAIARISAYQQQKMPKLSENCRRVLRALRPHMAPDGGFSRRDFVMHCLSEREKAALGPQLHDNKDARTAAFKELSLVHRIFDLHMVKGKIDNTNGGLMWFVDPLYQEEQKKQAGEIIARGGIPNPAQDPFVAFVPRSYQHQQQQAAAAAATSGVALQVQQQQQQQNVEQRSGSRRQREDPSGMMMNNNNIRSAGAAGAANHHHHRLLLINDVNAAITPTTRVHDPRATSNTREPNHSQQHLNTNNNNTPRHQLQQPQQQHLSGLRGGEGHDRDLSFNSANNNNISNNSNNREDVPRTAAATGESPWTNPVRSPPPMLVREGVPFLRPPVAAVLNFPPPNIPGLHDLLQQQRAEEVKKQSAKLLLI